MIVLVLIAVAGWGSSRVPTGFIPTEDQGYVLVSVELPNAASLARTQRAMAKVREMILANTRGRTRYLNRRRFPAR